MSHKVGRTVNMNYKTRAGFLLRLRSQLQAPLSLGVRKSLENETQKSGLN